MWRREVERAASKRKPIIPFRIDGAALNPELEYFLSNSQWIDVPKLGHAGGVGELNGGGGAGVGDFAASSAESSCRLELEKRVALAAAVLVAIGVAVGLGWHSWSLSHNAAQPATVAMADKSIAVLPFADMSEKKDQEYFGDGMAEEIIDLLAKIPILKVIGRTSSFQFKGKTQDLRSIGEAAWCGLCARGKRAKVG